MRPSYLRASDLVVRYAYHSLHVVCNSHDENGTEVSQFKLDQVTVAGALGGVHS